jgi:hypothetical protein
VFHANLPGGDREKFMPEPDAPLDKDCATASVLRQLMLKELGGQIDLDEATIDALVRGIMSLIKPN